MAREAVVVVVYYKAARRMATLQPDLVPGVTLGLHRVPVADELLGWLCMHYQ